MLGLKQYNLVIVDEKNEPIGSGLSVRVTSDIGTLTIYANDMAASKTNPITSTLDGRVEFWHANDTVDLLIEHARATVTVNGLSVLEHRVVVPLNKAEFVSLPVAASTTIVLGDMLSVNSSGYINDLQAGETFVGHAIEAADNSAGADGVMRVKVRCGQYAKQVTLTSVAVTDVGDSVYASDDSTLSLTASTNSQVGAVRAYVAANTALVEFDTCGGAIAPDTITGAKIADDAIDSEHYTAGSIDAEHLSTTLKTGFIPVPLTTLREVVSNDITNLAGVGGILAKDSTPNLEFANGDTDSCLRLDWVNNNNDPVVFQVPLPPDLDVTADVVVHARIASAGTTDAVGFNCDSYFNEGDTKVEDDTGTNQTTAYAEVTATIAAADVPEGAQTLTCELTPVAHTTDVMYCTAIWIEYTKA